MRYITGDLWSLAKPYEFGWVVVPTNTQLKKDGTAVMGAGLAKEAANRIHQLPTLLGSHIREWEDEIFTLHEPPLRIVCLPTKRSWRKPSDINLIERGCQSLRLLAYQLNNSPDTHEFFVPRLGCGLGGLDWEREVRPIVDSMLDKRYFIGVNPQ